MGDERDVQRRMAVLAQVYDELVAEIDTGTERSRHAELQTLAGDVEWALSRCRANAGGSGAPERPDQRGGDEADSARSH